MELIKALLEQEGLRSADTEPIGRRAGDGPAALSFAQERVWFFGRMAPASPVFNIPAAYRVSGPLDVERLERAFARVVARHATLRTRFAVKDGRAVALVATSLEAPIERHDLTGLAEAEREAAALAAARESARRPFDLEVAPLVRLALWRTGEAEHLLLVNVHHIVSEVQSLGVLVRDLARYYALEAGVDGVREPGEPAEPAELPIQFADFAAWQRERMEGQRYAEQLAWWKERLAGELPPLQMPTDRPRPAVQTYEGGTRTRVLAAETTERLRAFCRGEKVTPFAVGMALWSALLSRYAGEEDVLVGTPVTDRDRSELADLIGFFVNTLVIRCDLSGDPTLRELVRRVREFQLGAQSNRDLPFEQLVEELDVERDLSRSPLFQVAFLYQSAGEAGAEALELAQGTTLRAHPDPLAVHTRTSKFDASLILWDRPAEIAVSAEYAADLFDEDTIDRMLGHYEELLSAALAEPERALSSLGLLTAAERDEILHEWNATSTPIREDVCVDALFEEQVDRTPDAVAVVDEERTLTYRELDERANRLAHHLRGLGVGPDQPVAIATERCLEMVVGILGTLKAGGAYLPIDLAYPKERLGYVFEDAGVAAVLTCAAFEPKLPEAGRAPRIRLDADWDAIAASPSTRPERVTTSANLAYVIYTSGSTGTPKGVDLGHTGLVNLLTWHQRAYDVQPRDQATHLAGLAFDASVWELWPYLTAGSALHLCPDDVRLAPGRLVAWMKEHAITQSFIPTPLCEAVMREELPAGMALEVVLTGGDKLHRAPERELGFDLYNQYGPTENTVVATATFVPVAPDDETPPPIGRPIDNCTIYLFDRHGHPVPVGVPGELYIGGKSLARGYHGRPDMTAERFVTSPVDGKTRLYRTGDNARWTREGQIEFLGRLDGQVKVRGFRIELGEIEAVLGDHPDVAECAVVIRQAPGREDGQEGQLIGYVVASASETDGAASDGATSDGRMSDGAQRGLTSEALRAHLRDYLPEYMVPSAVLVLDAMPLTENGKIDRRALPEPDLSAQASEFVDPTGELEEKIAAVWRAALDVERVGATTNFFDLGGHSLLLARIHSELQGVLGQELSIVELFRYPTVASLAAHWAGRDGERAGEAEIEESRDRGAKRRAAMRGRGPRGGRGR